MGRKARSREIIEDRQNKVKELYFIRRIKIKKIAKLLDWSEATIWNDKQAIRINFYDELNEQGINVKDILSYIQMSREKVIADLWTDLDNTTNTTARANIKDKILEANRSVIKDLQDLGIIPKPKETMEIKKSTTMEEFKKIMEDG